MKIYYAEHGIFPATYNFKDDEVGAEPSGWTSNNGAGCTTTIISNLDGHKKVLKLFDNNDATRCEINSPTYTAVADNIVEYWFRVDSVAGLRYFNVGLFEGATALFYIIIDNNDLDYYNGGYVSIKDNSIIVDTWHHLKIIPDDSANTFDVYFDGILEGVGLTYWHNSTTGHTKVELSTRTNIGVVPFTGYFDALGIESDADYNIGDNLFVDLHDPYNKIQITSIDTYPTIIPKLDAYFKGSFTVRDNEGQLFSDWNDKDFNIVLIEDNSNNVLFRGFLTGKLFTRDLLTIFIAGIGILFDWQPFGKDGFMNYIISEGLVKAPLSANSILQVKDLNGDDFTWDPAWWVKDAKDLGLLIVDKTAVNTRTWDSSAISQVGGTVRGGNNASTTTFNDGDYYTVREGTITPGNPITVITPIIDGVAVDDTDFLQSIDIEYSFRIYVTAGILARNWGKIYLQILKDTTWETIATATAEAYFGSVSSGWIMGIPIDVDGGNGNQFVIKDTDAELRKYFNKTGPTYTSLKGMRLRSEGDLKTDSYFDIHVDFINVIVSYTSLDVSPVMEVITDSIATAITCSDVSAWDEMGVVENDGFKIGQNTRTIIKDIASEAEIQIELVDNFGNVSVSNLIYPNADTATIQWTSTGGDHFGELNDGNDATYVTETSDGQRDIFAFGDINLRGGYVSSLVISCRQKCNVIERCAIGISYSLDGGVSWSTEKSDELTVNWVTESVDWLGLEIYDLSDFQVRLFYDESVPAGQAFVSELYVVFYISGSSFSKYMARLFKGSYCMEALTAALKLEGAHWYEDYINNKIGIAKPADFVDSTVDLTEANYDQDWEYEDDCNQVKSFYVFGKSDDEIFAKAVDQSISGYISRQIIDESITNVADAQEIADAQLAILKIKRPSIKITLDGVNANLQLGTTVGLTMVRPTVAEKDYIIRKIERSKFGDGIQTIIYCGLGESTVGEKIAKFIRDNAFRSHKALIDRLISP